MFIDIITVENGLLVVQDVHGRVHILNDASGIPVDDDKDYIWEWAYHTDQWADVNNFYDLYDTASSTQFTITATDELSVDMLNMAQTGDFVSLIALVVDGTTRTVLPLLNEYNTRLNEPMTIPSGSELTIKVKPSHKNTKVAVTLRGYYE
jgi:hypothetical protein